MKLDLFIWGALLMAMSWSAGILRAAEESKAGAGDEATLEQANALFAEANESALTDPARASELYSEAALKFEYLLGERGYTNGRLFANLANSYFLAGDLGHSILNYRRAQQYAPGDREIFESLEYTRTQCVDVFPQSPVGQIKQTVFFWHYRLDQRARITLFALAYVALWGLAAWQLFNPGRKSVTLRRLCVAVCLLTGISIVMHVVDSRQNRDGVVVVPEVEARKGDGYIYEPALTSSLHAGVEFSLIERRGEWLHCRFGNDEEAWLPASSVEFVVPEDDGEA